jgi:hypothetical protein
MRRSVAAFPRLIPPSLLIAVVLSACAVEPQGPTAPIAPAQITPAPALDASASRQVVVDFIEAYRASPTQGVGPLAGLVAGEDLGSWVRWLDVQHREFDGDISATSNVRDVEFIGSVEARRATGSQVGLSASVTFTYDPVDEDAIELVRVLDGPVTLVRTAPASYRVLDLLRNGVPMSDSIERFRNQVQTHDGVTVRLDSMFMFPPNWQFNIVVENASGRNILLDPEASALFAEQGGELERFDGVITASLLAIPAGGTVDGLMVYPAQEVAQGRVLSLVYGTGRRALRFAFPLDGLVTVVPPPPPTDEETVEASPS